MLNFSKSKKSFSNTLKRKKKKKRMHWIFWLFWLSIGLCLLSCFNRSSNVPISVPVAESKGTGPLKSILKKGVRHDVLKLANANNQFPGKPYFGETHNEIFERSKRGVWFADVDREWRDGMMPRPPEHPAESHMVSMPY